jgi:hypothetical protein
LLLMRHLERKLGDMAHLDIGNTIHNGHYMAGINPAA